MSRKSKVCWAGVKNGRQCYSEMPGNYKMHRGPQSTFSLRFQIRLWIFFTFCFTEEDVENFDVTNLSQDMLRSIEADSFWCMSKLLDGIQVSRLQPGPGLP